MQFITIFLALLTAVPTITAAPTTLDLSTAVVPKPADAPDLDPSTSPARRSPLEKRRAGCVFLTSNQFWTGDKTHLCLQDNQRGKCVGLSDHWAKNVSSFGPDKGTSCVLFQDVKCKGRKTVSFTSPGFQKLGIWDNRVRSCRCNW